MAEQLLHSFDEGQAILGGISRSGMYNLAGRGEIKLVHIGRRSFITAESLHAYVERLTAAADDVA